MHRYRAHGVAGLARKARTDRGRQRRVTLELTHYIEGLALRKPPPSVATIHRQIVVLATQQGGHAPSYRSVYEIVKRLDPALTESGATVTHGSLPTVVAESRQIGQVVQNLLSNALKFRGPEAPRIHLWAQQQGDEWVIAVQDNGIGIEPRHAERIFGIFQRLHPREAYPGTGMGLAICRKIVERHGGRIWVESPPSQGATFFFTLPMFCGKSGVE
jgi:light-regulated signal transduction histidine kinase (bacteriophytochrome)